MVIRAIVIVLALWMTAGTAFAICPYPTPKVCSLFFESDAVFVGTVLSQEYSDNGEYIRFTVRVSRVLRGSVGPTAAVYTGNDSARLLWEIGKEYVVFARLQDRRLESGNDCGPLSDSARVAETIRQIESLRGQTSASIEGEIRSAPPDGPGIADVDVTVRIHGGGRTYETKSDSRGLFRVRVPPGQYEVVVDPKLRTSDYNWYNLHEIKLVRGQCAQLQLVPR
jgi:carboxypeptidase family protein